MCAHWINAVGVEEEEGVVFQYSLFVIKTGKKRIHCTQLCTRLVLDFNKCGFNCWLSSISNITTTYVLSKLQLKLKSARGLYKPLYRECACSRTTHVHPSMAEFPGDPTGPEPYFSLGSY